jgi:type III secretion protein L
MEPKILKADAIGEKIPLPSPKILKREVYDAGREAREVVELAQEKAQQIIDQAERERQRITEEARQEGIAKGLAEWNEILARAASRAEELSNSWEETMLRLAVKVAEKIIGEQLTVQPATIVGIVREVLKGTRAGRHMTIQVNESEAQQVRSRIDSLKELGVSSEIAIVASQSIPPGGCVVESELGIIDARLETQLKCLENILVRGASEARPT